MAKEDKKAKRADWQTLVIQKLAKRISAGEFKSWDQGLINTKGRPRNAATGNYYNGGNAIAAILLSPDDRLMTFKQGQAMRDTDPNSPNFVGYKYDENGEIDCYKVDYKGAKKGSPKFADCIDREACEDLMIPMVKFGRYDKNKGKKGTKKDIASYLMGFDVYPLSAFRGIDRSKLGAADTVAALKVDRNSCPILEEWISGYCGGTGKGPRIVRDARQAACYSPMEHKISLFPREQYADLWRALKTECHELIHSTGHADVCDRKPISDCSFTWGDHAYSREELVAELGSALLCSKAGIWSDENEENSAAYMTHWLSVLKAEPSMLWQCASAAQKAVDAITGETWQERAEQVASA